MYIKEHINELTMLIITWQLSNFLSNQNHKHFLLQIKQSASFLT